MKIPISVLATAILLTPLVGCSRNSDVEQLRAENLTLKKKLEDLEKKLAALSEKPLPKESTNEKAAPEGEQAAKKKLDAAKLSEDRFQVIKERLPGAVKALNDKFFPPSVVVNKTYVYRSEVLSAKTVSPTDAIIAIGRYDDYDNQTNLQISFTIKLRFHQEKWRAHDYDGNWDKQKAVAVTSFVHQLMLEIDKMN